MKFSAGENRDGMIVISLEKDDRPDNEVHLNSMDVMSLMSLLQTLLKEGISDPAAGPWAHANIHHLQFRMNPNGDQSFCIYLTPSIFHEYVVPANTNLSVDLKEFADRVSARQLARATIQPIQNETKN